LDPDEFERLAAAIFAFQAQLNRFTHSLYQCVKVLRLRVTARERGNCSDEITFFVSLNNDRKFSRSSHWLDFIIRSIMPPRRLGDVPA
jgi:hypothetical protein